MHVPADARAYVIWSFEHDAWWGPNRIGYELKLVAAGRYTKAEALAIEANANRYLRHGAINEQAMLESDAQASGPPGRRQGRRP